MVTRPEDMTKQRHTAVFFFQPHGFRDNSGQRSFMMHKGFGECRVLRSCRLCRFGSHAAPFSVLARPQLDTLLRPLVPPTTGSHEAPSLPCIGLVQV